MDNKEKELTGTDRTVQRPEDRFCRTRLLIGDSGLARLNKAHVAVFGIGGVGGFAVEALARSGIGHLTLVDRDIVNESNLNRQIIALNRTIGRAKTDVMRERILDINPSAEVICRQCFYLPDTAGEFDFSKYDYIVDAVDTVTAKLELIRQAGMNGTKVISCMGTGNKTDPGKLTITDIYETSGCPLARVMRKELKKRGVEALTVLYSTEPPIEIGQATPGSMIFVPGTAGLMIAAQVVRDLLQLQN